MSKKNDKKRNSIAVSSKIRELSESENAEVNGGAYLRSGSVGTIDTSMSPDSLRGNDGVVAETYTTLGCIDSDDGTVWGCSKVTI